MTLIDTLKILMLFKKKWEHGFEFMGTTIDI